MKIFRGALVFIKKKRLVLIYSCLRRKYYKKLMHVSRQIEKS